MRSTTSTSISSWVCSWAHGWDYALFYNLPFYVSHPLEVFVLWHGGMSFHGGAIGTFVFGYWAVRRKGISFLKVADLIVPTIPLGLFFGRMGNFINGELWGRPTTMPWAMIFPSGGPVARHPVPALRGSLLEGLVLFAILWICKGGSGGRATCSRPSSYGMPSSAYFASLPGTGRSGGLLFRPHYHGADPEHPYARDRDSVEIRLSAAQGEETHQGRPLLKGCRSGPVGLALPTFRERSDRE